ncbi:MAG: TIM barrel protein, partial [Verrucomicrobiota bacterium]
RYRQLLELGSSIGIVPQVEMWGGHPAIGTVEKAMYIALRADHPNACFLGDVYHTYKGGCGFEGFRLLSAKALQVFHFNDYPAEPSQAMIKDEHRVFPGDGVAPLEDLIRSFADNGAYPVLSLELFNREYWERPAEETARTGLAKMKSVVARSLRA